MVPAAFRRRAASPRGGRRELLYKGEGDPGARGRVRLREDDGGTDDPGAHPGHLGEHSLRGGGDHRPPPGRASGIAEPDADDLPGSRRGIEPEDACPGPPVGGDHRSPPADRCGSRAENRRASRTGEPEGEQAPQLPRRAFRRRKAAGGHRPRARRRCAVPRGGRADERPRRLHPGPGRQPPAGPSEASRPVVPVHLARPARGGARKPQGGRHVHGDDRGDRAVGGHRPRPPPSVHAHPLVLPRRTAE